MSRITQPIKTRVKALAFCYLAGLTINATASIKIEGCFVAIDNCDALHSIKKHTNPGNISLKPFGLYSVTAKNKPKPTHYQVKVGDVNPLNRWVPASCGNYVENCRLLPVKTPSTSTPATPTSSTTGTTTTPQEGKRYLLALSWEPAFCETHQQKTECQTLTSERKDAKQLSLHGLWPQPRNNAYCNVDSTAKAIDRRKKWGLLEPLELTEATRNELAIIMPGYASNLQRHEWTKHGTCYGTNADTYYQHAIKLTEAINQSAVGDLFASNVGKEITAKAIRSTFNQSFGEGAGTKVNVRCDKKGRLAELWINISGNINKDSSIENLLKNATRTNNSCSGGLVDAVD